MKKQKVKWYRDQDCDCAFIEHEKLLITFKKGLPVARQKAMVDRMLNRDRAAITMALAYRGGSVYDDVSVEKTSQPFSLIISD